MIKYIFALSLVLVGIGWMIDRFSENIKLAHENKKPPKKRFILPSQNVPPQDDPPSHKTDA